MSIFCTLINCPIMLQVKYFGMKIARSGLAMFLLAHEKLYHFKTGMVLWHETCLFLLAHFLLLFFFLLFKVFSLFFFLSFYCGRSVKKSSIQKNRGKSNLISTLVKVINNYCGRLIEKCHSFYRWFFKIIKWASAL